MADEFDIIYVIYDIEFYTRAKAVKDASHLHIDSIGIDVDIISWEQYQSHSVIYV